MGQVNDALRRHAALVQESIAKSQDSNEMSQHPSVEFPRQTVFTGG